MPEAGSQVETVEENVQVARAENQMIIEDEVPRSPAGSPVFNAPQAGRPSTPVSTNKPQPSFFYVSHLFESFVPPSTPFYLQLLPPQTFTPLVLIKNPPSQLNTENHHFFQNLSGISLRMKIFSINRKIPFQDALLG